MGALGSSCFCPFVLRVRPPSLNSPHSQTQTGPPYTHTHTHRLTQTGRQKQAYKHPSKQTHRCTRIHTDTQSHRHLCRYAQTHIPTYTQTHVCIPLCDISHLLVRGHSRRLFSQWLTPEGTGGQGHPEKSFPFHSAQGLAGRALHPAEYRLLVH